MLKKKNHRAYSQAQQNRTVAKRGELTLWICEEFLQNWQSSHSTGKKGAPQRYSDLAIVCANQMRFLYKLPLRATQAFLQSLFSLLKSDQPVPCYTTLCRRLKNASIDIPAASLKTAQLIVLDSTGLKIYSERESKIRQNSLSKRRVWRKIRVRFDAISKEIVCSFLKTKKKQ